MRLHSLQLSAFGPFPGVVEVDMTALGADGLFLLHGDTGAGKTTLLDAIAFALFGRVPGARNDARRLRCDRADPAVRTFVRLEATVGGHRVEIVRSPSYLRPKARGSGMTEEKHKVTLRWLDSRPDGAPITGLSRAEEVGLTVRELLGMSADQFFQVVLLPQGEFARFLRSDTADREVLLERLFDTGRFGTVEDWFAAARRESASRLRDRRAAIDQLAARVAEAAGLSMCPLDASPAWIADVRDRLADQCCLALEHAALAAADQLTADGFLAAGQQLAARMVRLRALRSRQDELERLAGRRAAWRRSIAAAADARPVLLAAADLERRQQHTAAARTAAEQRRAVAERLVAAEDDVPKTGSDLRASSALVRMQAGELDALIGLARDQDADVARLGLLTDRQLQIRRELDELAAVLVPLPASISALTATVGQADVAAQAVGLMTERLAAADRLVAAARLLAACRAKQQQAARLAIAAGDEHHRAVDVRQDLMQRRIQGMAAELAAALTPGAECPVCGAADHPRPAASGGDAVTAEQISAAQAAEERAAQARRRADERNQAAGDALTAAAAQAQGRTPEVAAAEQVETAELLRAATAAAAELPAAAAALRSATDRLREATAAHQRLTARAVAGTAEMDRLATVVARRTDRLDQARAGFPNVAARRRYLLELAGALDDLAAADERLEVAEVARSEATTALLEALRRSPFPDLAAARNAAEVDAQELTRRLRAAEDELTGITARLSEPDLAGLDNETEPDVAALWAAADSARAVAGTAGIAAAAAAARRDRVATAAAHLQDAWSGAAPVLAADAELAALTDVILGKGQNYRAMSLRSYVLAAKMSQVAESAGQRLSAMSGGRYSFVAAQDKETRGRSGGLGLDILDAFSGLARPAKTLSGGESFLASLALALGLADVVAAEAGGRQLDTMFIDEGFGSLDADTLDMVMGTLDELRAGGRIVGLVSHVDELRQRIPSRLRIRRTATGSELEMSIA